MLEVVCATAGKQAMRAKQNPTSTRVIRILLSSSKVIGLVKCHCVPVSLLQVLQNVNSAAHAAQSSCLPNADLLSCRAMHSLETAVLAGMQALIERRHEEMVRLIRAIVELESPSGDVVGSRTVNQLLADVARTIPSVSQVERISSPECGEHLLITAFAKDNSGAQPTLILGHTDTVHP